MKTTFVADDSSAVSELALLRSMIIGSDVCVSICEARKEKKSGCDWWLYD
jgi:hypothetical protein